MVTKLDYQQVIQQSFDEANSRLRVDAAITMDPVDQEVSIDAADDSVAIGDGTNLATLTVLDDRVGLDVNVVGGVSGDFTSSGLSTGLTTKKIMVGDVATPVPLVPLANRNAMSVRVWSNSVVYFGDATVTTDGYPKMQYEEIILDIKDNNAVTLYAICAPGQSAELRILELA